METRGLASELGSGFGRDHGPGPGQTDDRDVEGHSLPLDPYTARELGRAREREVRLHVQQQERERQARSSEGRLGGLIAAVAKIAHARDRTTTVQREPAFDGRAIHHPG